jgi:hypothetical protein
MSRPGLAAHRFVALMALAAIAACGRSGFAPVGPEGAGGDGGVAEADPAYACTSADDCVLACPVPDGCCGGRAGASTRSVAITSPRSPATTPGRAIARLAPTPPARMSS